MMPTAEPSATSNAVSAGRKLTSLAAGILCLLGLPGAGDPQSAATIPDFTGEWARPANMFDFAPPRVDGVPGPLANVSGNRLVPIADHANPILRPWAAAAVKEHGDTLSAGVLAADAHTQCRPMGVPYVLQVRGNVQFLQTPDWILITYEDDNQRRLVRLDQKHSANPEPSPMGESIGHYEGHDTLVIDTIGIAIRDVSSIDRFGTPHTEGLRVVERYRIAAEQDGQKILEVDIMVEDPGTFAAPWHASSIYRAGGYREEDICAENIRGFHGPALIEIPTDEMPDF
jgi:hypothetical protein